MKSDSENCELKTYVGRVKGVFYLLCGDIEKRNGIFQHCSVCGGLIFFLNRLLTGQVVFKCLH